MLTKQFLLIVGLKIFFVEIVMEKLEEKTKGQFA